MEAAKEISTSLLVLSKKTKRKVRKSYSYVGHPTKRVDARDKVTGAADFLADMEFPNLLHARMVLSPLPHARIKSIDTTRAKASEGVTAVLTGRDIPCNQVGLIIKDQPLLADERVRYAGDCIAIVAAENESEAARAASLVEVGFQPRKPVFSARLSLRSGSPKIHPDGNLVSHWKVRRGNHEKPLKGADVIIEGDFITPRQEHFYLETLGTVAVPHKNGAITIYGSIQCPYYVQRSVSETLKLPYNKVRIIQTHTGGAFGGKEDVPSEICSRTAALALTTGRPVRLILDREEDTVYSSKRHPFEMTYRLGAKKNGRLIGVLAEQFASAGAYATLSPVVIFRAVIHAAGPYVVPNVRIDTRAVYTNHPPSGAFRGFGAPQSAFGMECAMDMLADALDRDPLDLREQNALRAGTRTVTGQLLKESVGLRQTIREAREKSGWSKRRAARKSIGRYVQGIGSAVMHYGNCLGAMGWYLDAAGAYVQVHRDGSIAVSVGIAEIGQGSTTTITQMAAEALGVNAKRIRVLEVDTTLVPDSGPTVASRSTIMSGNAVLDAVQRLMPGLKAAAARLLKTSPSKIRFRNDRAYASARGSRGISFDRVAEEAFTRNERLAAAGWWAAPFSSWDPDSGLGDTYFAYSFATHIARVQVDKLTGKIKLLELTAAHDVGRAINPEGVRAQAEGGIVQGLGYALTEETKFNEGVLLNPRLSTYLLPYPLETPKINTIIVEDEGPDGPFGAKSMGEPPIIPVAPAIANAVSDALGVRFNEIPITPERVLGTTGELRHDG